MEILLFTKGRKSEKILLEPNMTFSHLKLLNYIFCELNGKKQNNGRNNIRQSLFQSNNLDFVEGDWNIISV